MPKGHQRTGETAIARAHPSLALIKYWGKADTGKNLPATPSLAISLEDLRTETRVRCSAQGTGASDVVEVGGQTQPPERYGKFFHGIRSYLESRGISGATKMVFHAESASNFPSAAGLASSASGFAALTIACVAAAGMEFSSDFLAELSALARLGSGSAARSLYGGFTKLDAGSEYACPLRPADWWPDLRVLVVQVASGSKAVSSRDAMERTRNTSPYYESWINDARAVTVAAEQTIEERDLDALGGWMRLSYQRMFATMHAADPPILYWLPESVAAIRLCEDLRSRGVSAWETMDAGPQVKVLCREKDLATIEEEFHRNLPNAHLMVSRIGGTPAILPSSPLLDQSADASEKR